MDSHVRAYWVDRLQTGQIFFAPQKRKAVFDYRVREGDTAAWPTYVAKEALFQDYCAWTEKRVGATRAMAELYRQLGPVLFPFGKDKHTRRLKTDVPVRVDTDRVMMGRMPRVFIRMASLEVLRASYGLQMGHGVASERSQWGTLVKNAGQAFV